MPPFVTNAYKLGWYISIMSLASITSLLRGFLIAELLSLVDFGRYVTIVATGMFFSTILSFGETEKTIKLFPRLWIEGRFDKIVENTDKSAYKLIARATLVAYLLFGCMLVGLFGDIVTDALLITLVSLNAAIASLYASAIRATGKTNLLSLNTLVRAVFVLGFAALGALYFSWLGAIIGEALGFMIGSCLTRISIIKLIKHDKECQRSISENDCEIVPGDSKYWLFLATICAAAPTLLDRAYVSIVYDQATVGTQGFLMLFVTAASTFTGIINQKVGPQLIKMQHSGASMQLQMRYSFRWLMLIWGLIGFGLVIVGILLLHGPARNYFDKFQLDFNLMSATSLLCLMQISVVTDHILISRNWEKAVFFAAFIYFIGICLGGYFVWWFKLPLSAFIWILSGCKFLHISMQLIISEKISQHEYSK